MNPFKHALIVGASSGVGRALAVELANFGSNVTIAARDQKDLEILAQHIRINCSVTATVAIIDLSKPVTLDYSQFDAVFITAGVSIAEDDVEKFDNKTSSNLLSLIMSTNLLGPTQILIDSYRSFSKRSERTYIGACSSIAAPVPRTKNPIYAAAKGGLESFLRSLQHAAAALPVTIQIFRLGYVDSSLSYGQKLLFPALSPEAVARIMISAASCPKKRLVYVPGYWHYIIMVLNLLPWKIFSRLRF